MNRERAEAHLRPLAEAELRRVPTLPTDSAVSHRLALVTQALFAVGAATSPQDTPVRDSLCGSVTTWDFSGRTNQVDQDHPVYIPRDLNRGYQFWAACPQRSPLPVR